jgi:hypothetical protein
MMTAPEMETESKREMRSIKMKGIDSQSWRVKEK